AELHQHAGAEAPAIWRQLDNPLRVDAGLDELASETRHQPVDLGAVVVHDHGEVVGIEGLRVHGGSFVGFPTICRAETATNSAPQDGATTAASAPATRGPVDVGKPGRLRKEGLAPVTRQVARTLRLYNGAPSMKLSARNVLPGKVVPITKGATTEHVRIEVGAEMVTASIPNDAVDALALEVGKLAPAVIQASDVMIVIDV